MNLIKIGNKTVGKKFQPFFIAEGGINHNGKLHIAKKLVEKAAWAGADAVKFQTFNTEKFYVRNHPLFKHFKKYELSKESFGELRDFSKSNNIIFFSTPFDFESVDLLTSLKIPINKIASGDLTYLPLIEYVSKNKKPLIISTGMGKKTEIWSAIRTAKKAGAKKIILLHSITAYPPPLEEINLNSIAKMKKEFNLHVGFSDNGNQDATSVLATYLGASVIEKHFTLNSKQKGADHSISSEPQNLKNLILILKSMEKMLGDGNKTIQPSEKKILAQVRRGVYAGKDMKKNSILKKNDIIFLRPSNRWSSKPGKVIGKKLKNSLKFGDKIEVF